MWDGAAVFLLGADFVSFAVIALQNLFDTPQVEKPPKALPGLGELVRVTQFTEAILSQVWGEP